jgi:hypothetical protein
MLSYENAKEVVMRMIQIECGDDRLIEILEAIRTLSRNVKIFSPIEMPNLPSDQKEFDARALAIAQAIKPRPNQEMRLETLELVLGGGDTWFDQKGERDPALRNATGALSKALRRFAPYSDSPLEILCERRREIVPTGPYKGRYQGTRYVPTRLGRRVREILQEWGIMRRPAGARADRL